MNYISFAQREEARYSSQGSRERAFAFSLEELEGIGNQIITRDTYSNAIINEMLNKFLDKNFENVECIEDNFIQVLNYTIDSLEDISRNPKLKLEKKYELQNINKIGKTDSKTINWLVNKPGKTIPEKIGVRGKILAPKNVYSVDKKENRIINFYFKKVYEILEKRYMFMELENKKVPEKLKNLYRRYYRVRRTLIDKGIHELKRPLDFEPNNTLIDHRDYSVINRGLKIFNNSIEKKDISLREALKMASVFTFFKIVNILSRLEDMKLVNNPVEIENIMTTDIRKNEKIELFYEGEKIYKLKINFQNDRIAIKLTELVFDKKTKMALDNKKLENQIILNFQLSEVFGKYLNFKVNEKEYLLNQEGVSELTKETIEKIFEIIGRIPFKEKKEIVDLKNSAYLNFNSKIPFYNQEYIKETVYDDINNVFLKTREYHYLINKVSKVNEVTNLDKFIKNTKQSKSLESKVKIIYPTLENQDSDNQKAIQAIMSTNFDKSYPVWKSILAAYVLEYKQNYIFDRSNYFVLDLNNNNPSINILKKKKEIYEHHPALEYNFEGISLDKFLEVYLRTYSKNNNLKISKDEIANLLTTGKVYDCIFNKRNHIIILKGRRVLLEFDAELKDSLVKSFSKSIDRKISEFLSEFSKISRVNKLIIISDYLDQSYLKSKVDIVTIKEKELEEGSSLILEKIEKNEVVWNEFLPNLSLETIKDNHFYNLDLIKDKSLDLTLGKEIIFDVNEKFILPSQKEKLSFPLYSEDSFNKKMYSLEIKSNSFPLLEPKEVKLKIGYSYGSQDPYRIIIEAISSEEKIEFKTKWLEKINEFNPKLISFPKNKNDVTIDDVKKTIKKIERSLHFNKDEELLKELKRNKNRIRRCIAREINENNISEILELMPKENHPLVLRLQGEISDELKLNIGLFLSAFGSFTNFIISEELIEKENYKRRTALFYYKVRKENFSEIYKFPKQQIQIISEMAWLDKEFMQKLVEKEVEVAKSCLIEVRKNLEKINKNFDFEYQKKKNRGWELTNNFRDCLEFILAVLMNNLSNEKPLINEVFNKKQLYLMLNNIKSIDRKIQTDKRYSDLKEFYDKNIRIEFELNKKEDLCNMSDLAYSVYNLITGDDGGDSIKISGIAEEN